MKDYISVPATVTIVIEKKQLIKQMLMKQKEKIATESQTESSLSLSLLLFHSFVR